MVTLDQQRTSLKPDWTVAETLTGGRGDTVMVGGQVKHVIGYMKDFLFSPEQARTPVSVLSGGERNRLMLARALSKPSNLLILDEPTNDLDLETLDLLEEMIDDYTGTVLVVSHDRDFLDRTVSSVLIAEGQGRWIEYAGGYSDMLVQRGHGVEARVVEKSKRQKAASSSTSATSQPNKRKLSFNEQHDLKTLPDKIAKLESQITILQEKLDDPSLYSRDPNLFSQITEKITIFQEELAGFEDRWLELEMLRQEIEGS